MTVEGDKFIGAKLISKIDSIEPGDTEKFSEFTPAELDVSCMENDEAGLLKASGDIVGMRLFKARKRKVLWVEIGDPKEYQLDPAKPATFSGEELIIVFSTRSYFDEKLVFRHQKGEPEQPPRRRERIPRMPSPPFRKTAEENQTEEEPEKIEAVAKR